MTEQWSATVTNDAHVAEAARLAKRYHSDVKRLDRSRDDVAYAVKGCVSQGMTEQAVADLVGVTRVTIRKWLGKDKR